MDRGSLAKRFIGAFDGMSARHQTPARCVLHHPRDVALSSMWKQAWHVGVHPATMMLSIRLEGTVGAGADQLASAIDRLVVVSVDILAFFQAMSPAFVVAVILGATVMGRGGGEPLAGLGRTNRISQPSRHVTSGLPKRTP